MAFLDETGLARAVAEIKAHCQAAFSAIGHTHTPSEVGGSTANAHATAKGSAFASGLYKITTNSEGHVISASAVVKSDITALDIPAQNTTYGNATQSTAGLMSADDKAKLDALSGGGSSGGVTGVKGDSETSYRTGLVSLSASDVGAASSSHGHEITGITGLSAALDLKSNTNHNHEGVYAANSHTHTMAQVTGLDDALGTKANSSHSHSAATTSAAGFMSAADKAKLNAINADADSIGLGSWMWVERSNGNLTLMWDGS